MGKQILILQSKEKGRGISRRDSTGIYALINLEPYKYYDRIDK